MVESGIGNPVKTALLTSPYVALDPHPDARRGLLTRRTFRTFERRPVAASVRASVLEAGRRAPHSGDVRFIVIDDPALKRELFRLTRESKDISNHWETLFKSSGLRGYVQDWGHTPFCVAVCAHPGTGPRHIHHGWNHHLASAMATENLALAARDHGMALVMYTHFSQEKLKRLLDVPFEWDACGVMGLGYPDLKRINPKVLEASLTRLPLADLVASERYGKAAPTDLIADRERSAAAGSLMTAMLTAVPTTAFADTPVAPEDVFDILRAAQWAPSAGNFQPIRYIVLRDRGNLARLDDLARESCEISSHWFASYRGGRGEHPDWRRAPLAVALVADPTRGGPHIHGEATHMIAGGLAAQNMWVMAVALGLGTTLVTHWIEEKVKVLLDTPRTWDLVGVMPFGVPAAAPSRPQAPTATRPALDTVVYQDLFGRPWDSVRE